MQREKDLEFKRKQKAQAVQGLQPFFLSKGGWSQHRPCPHIGHTHTPPWRPQATPTHLHGDHRPHPHTDHDHTLAKCWSLKGNMFEAICLRLGGYMFEAICLRLGGLYV